MRKYLMFVCVFVLFVLSSSHLFSQESWVEEVKVKAFDLVEKEEFEEAARMVKSAIDVAKQMYGESHSAVADLTTELAVIYFLAEEMEKSESFLKQALDIYQRSQNPDPIMIGSLHIKLSQLHENQGNMSKASFHMKQAIASYKKVVAADDPAIVDLERYLSTLTESEQTQELEAEKIEKQEETIRTDEPKEERKIIEREQRLEKEMSPEIEKLPESDAKTPLKKSRKTGRSDISFEIISVDCPEVFQIDKKNRDAGFPTITVTYRLHTQREQANWIERLDVICPDGTMIYGGGGTQWYFSSSQQDNPTYSVKGYSTEKKRGTYKFRLLLEGENLKTQILERSFKLK